MFTISTYCDFCHAENVMCAFVTVGEEGAYVCRPCAIAVSEVLTKALAAERRAQRDNARPGDTAHRRGMYRTEG